MSWGKSIVYIRYLTWRFFHHFHFHNTVCITLLLLLKNIIRRWKILSNWHYINLRQIKVGMKMGWYDGVWGAFLRKYCELSEFWVFLYYGQNLGSILRTNPCLGHKLRLKHYPNLILSKLNSKNQLKLMETSSWPNRPKITSIFPCFQIKRHKKQREEYNTRKKRCAFDNFSLLLPLSLLLLKLLLCVMFYNLITSK